MPKDYTTGFLTLECTGCGSRFALSDNQPWQPSDELGAFRKVDVVAKSWKYCPSCGSTSITISHEHLPYWEFVARAAGLTPSSGAQIMEMLHDQWLLQPEDDFMNFAREQLREAGIGIG